MLRTIFVAVPAFMRVEPLTISGPTTAAMLMFAVRGNLRIAVAAHADRERADALSIFQTADDVRRAAAGGDSDHDVALGELDVFKIFDRKFGRSSAPSTAEVRAAYPPAMTPTTCDGCVLNVGGHSTASSTPRRPEVPAPK